MILQFYSSNITQIPHLQNTFLESTMTKFLSERKWENIFREREWGYESSGSGCENMKEGSSIYRLEGGMKKENFGAKFIESIDCNNAPIH